MSISQDIQKRVAAIEVELNSIIKERADVIHGILVARIAQLHLVMLGPGGSGKTFLARAFMRHIIDAIRYETALDETTDPGQVAGPVDIKAMVDLGITRRVIDNMLPEATDAFLDEIFNANSPVLHFLQPIMNERVFHNPGPANVPLRSLIAGTNKLTADADLAPFFDRLHLRYQVDYLKSRTNQEDMVTEAIARMSQAGRGTTTSLATPTQVTVAELDAANLESLALNVDQPVLDAFFDLHAALRTEGGIVISDRRVVDGMNAVLANAWLRNHADVQVADLDILAHMWWPLQEQAPAARAIILSVANPSEKLALDLMTELDNIQVEFEGSKKLDESTQMRIAVEAVRNTKKLLTEARAELVSATAGGSDTRQLDELIGRAESFKGLIGKSVFGVPEDSFS